MAASNTTKNSSDNTRKSDAQDESTSKRVADRAHDAVDDAAERAEQAEHKLREGAEEARARGEAMVGNVRTLVAEHPVASLGAAFLAGVVISSLMRR